MGGCSSKPSGDDVVPSVVTRQVTSQGQSSPDRAAPQSVGQGVGTPGPSSQQNGSKLGRESPQVGVNSGERPPTGKKRPKTKVSSKVPSSNHKQTNPGATRSPRPLTSTVRQVLPEHFRFRILVVGKSGSGKSSLIKTVFKVDMTAAPESALGKVDINVEFRPGDNRYLTVHECSGLDSQASSSQELQTIRDFITHRTDPSCPDSERLHVVWICVPASDAIAGRLGDGVEEIRGLGSVPVVVVFTKFDVVVSKVRLDSPSESHERARTRAHKMCQDSCRDLFHENTRDVRHVPAAIVSENSRFIDLIDNVAVTTNKLITNSRAPSARSSGQGAEQRVGLAWSAALRVNHDIIIQASIEVGRSRYWRNLSSSLDFADQTLKNCVNIIHLDIVEIWNMNDQNRVGFSSVYLSSDEFKAKMSHLVKDLAGSANATSGLASSSGSTRGANDYADWVNDVYRGSQENVRCVMGYIVDLTVILYGIFGLAPGGIMSQSAELAFDRHWTRSRNIHSNIRNTVEATYLRTWTSTAPQDHDIFSSRVIELIKENCVPLQEVVEAQSFSFWVYHGVCSTEYNIEWIANLRTKFL
ncbi:hypothetical protein EDB85DRAFT_1897124 [Lactarius pseudohatsudake]|nr:hypothetical protein EDB85DRAFT_1897124 [Lactarius pseudohatsudake]